MPRSSFGTYVDPVDQIWLHCASKLGMRVERSDDAYASWDGRGTLTICTPASFDADDSVAQLILHEICHALVAGPAQRGREDWGLDNTDDASCAVFEHATHRLQAALLDRHGLRDVLAVTTDWRPYWDALPADPLSAGEDPAIDLARRAWPDAVRGAWSGPLADALHATAQIGAVVREVAGGSLWGRARPMHPLGLATASAGTCGTCAWRYDGHCAHTIVDGAPAEVDAAWSACVRWEPSLGNACGDCGACCHRGFDTVEVDADEPIAARADLVRQRDGRLSIPRPQGRCAALASGLPWRCSVYAIRPRSCAELEIGGPACLEARRRVGLSRF